MSVPRRILFVCTGNICRSAMAEHLLRHRAKERGVGVEVRSCGIAAESWFEVPDVVRRLLAEKGAPAFTHTATLATQDSLQWADLVLVMTAKHAEHLRRRFPQFHAKIRLLREYAGFGAQDVEDPMGRPDDTYVRCLAAIEESLEPLLTRSSGTVPGL